MAEHVISESVYSSRRDPDLVRLLCNVHTDIYTEYVYVRAVTSLRQYPIVNCWILFWEKLQEVLRFNENIEVTRITDKLNGLLCISNTLN